MKTIIVARSKKNGKYFRYDDEDYSHPISYVDSPLDTEVDVWDSFDQCQDYQDHEPEDIELVKFLIFTQEVETRPHPHNCKILGIYRDQHQCKVIRAHRDGSGYLITTQDKFGGRHYSDAKRSDITHPIIIDEAWAKKYWKE